MCQEKYYRRLHPSFLLRKAIDLSQLRVQERDRKPELLDLSLHCQRVSSSFGRRNAVVMWEHGFQIRVVSQEKAYHLCRVPGIAIARKYDDSDIWFVEPAIKRKIRVESSASRVINREPVLKGDDEARCRA